MTKPTVPLLDLKAQNDPLREDIRLAIDRVISSQRFVLGPEVEALERELAAYCGAEYAIGVSSGTDALLVALMAIGVGPGDEVVVPAFTFFATAGVVQRLGATPVFADIDPATFNLRIDGLEARFTPRTKAVIPVHLFGQMADLHALTALASARGVHVLEDAAQAIGAARDGRLAGSVGLISAFSFYPTKNLGAFGDAGMATTNDKAIAERVKCLREHGFERRYFNRMVGGNFRMDAIQGAVLRVKFRHLDAWTTARQRNAALLREKFEATSLVRDGHVVLPTELPGVRHIYNQFVIRARRRDELLAFLRNEGVGCEVYYPVPLHLQECFRHLGGKAGDFPESERAASEVLALPVYAEASPEMLDTVVTAIRRFYA